MKLYAINSSLKNSKAYFPLVGALYLFVYSLLVILIFSLFRLVNDAPVIKENNNLIVLIALLFNFHWSFKMTKFVINRLVNQHAQFLLENNHLNWENGLKIIELKAGLQTGRLSTESFGKNDVAYVRIETNEKPIIFWSRHIRKKEFQSWPQKTSNNSISFQPNNQKNFQIELKSTDLIKLKEFLQSSLSFNTN